LIFLTRVRASDGSHRSSSSMMLGRCELLLSTVVYRWLAFGMDSWAARLICLALTLFTLQIRDVRLVCSDLRLRSVSGLCTLSAELIFSQILQHFPIPLNVSESCISKEISALRWPAWLFLGGTFPLTSHS